MTPDAEKAGLEQTIVEVLKTIYDPEIPVNIWDLGLIYKVSIDNQFNVDLDMTLTAPNCPVADSLIEEVRENVDKIPQTKEVKVNLVFNPPWTEDLMSEEAKLELGYL